jgi:hypothetical protein
MMDLLNLVKNSSRLDFVKLIFKLLKLHLKLLLLKLFVKLLLKSPPSSYNNNKEESL